MRAFIFSLDAFVAFMVALVAIYSLIFFSSVPSAYYSMLTQAHYLSRDTLLALSTTACTPDISSSCRIRGSSVLDNIASYKLASVPSQRKALARETVGQMVPAQFGYKLEVSRDDGTWDQIYDTAAENDGHANKSRKLTVTTQVFTFGYSNDLNKPKTSVFNYLSCHGDPSLSISSPWDIVPTCGEATGGTYDGRPFGNIPPSEYMGGGDNLVPTPQVKIVRLTVFI